MKKLFPSLTSLESDGNTSFLRAARAGHLDKVLEHLRSNIDINTSNANGLNALHLASKDGHIEVVSELLKRGAKVDSATKKGNTALHIASLAGQEEVVKLLVQHGAAVNVQSQNGFTPLYMAAQENHDSVVKYLLANGANQSLATEDGFTPLAVAMQQGHDKVVAVLLESDTRGKVRLPALHIAAKKDDVKAAKLLLENEHNPDVTSKSGFTPLHIASHYGNEQIANLLIQKGADVNYSAKHNISPLHVAAKWGKTNMVSLLLDKGANIEAKTRDGLTPLHCAARSGHEQVVDKLLEKGAPISSKTKNGLAPLHMAAQGEHVDAARILLYHRAPVDEVTVDYLTALHVAAHCGHARVAKLLLDRQADANARALNGFTPLHIACKKNRIKVVELLLKHGASISATTESGLTPLHVASFMGCMNIVIYLLQHDANVDVPTVRGETPLHLAARANQTDIIRILLRNNAQVDARAREMQTPLHIASRLGNVDIVMLLLQHGAQVDTQTKDMYTALHIAAKEGQDEVASVLLENGASLNATTKKGFTPLHLAAKYGNMKVAKLLLQREAPVDAQGKNGVTPLHVASHYDHQNVALLLLDKGASPHATAKNGHTPLHIAAKKNQMDIATTLLEYGAKANAESKAGFTPLHLSAQEGHTDMTSLLIEHQADTNHHAKNGLTPIHLCAQEDRVNCAQILLKNGAKVDPETKSGYTPLHVASHFGQVNMVRFLLQNGADVKATTGIGYTPLHQAAQQGHMNIVNALLENGAQPNALANNGQTAHDIANKLGYITVTETLKHVTDPTQSPTAVISEEKYRVVAPEAMHEAFMSDSEEEGGEDTMVADQPYRYLTVDEMKSLGDDSLPIDVTRDERGLDSNRMVTSGHQTNGDVVGHIDGEPMISPQHIAQNYAEYTATKYMPDNVDIKHAVNVGFLVSFLVDARGGAMRGCRHSGVRVIVPPRCAAMPTRITCRYVKPQRTPHPPPLMEGEALASRVLELGPVGAKFLGPVILEVPHFAALRGKEREIVILRSDNGENWREHIVEPNNEDLVQDVLHDSFEAEDLSQMEDISSGRITRIVTKDFPQYFAVVSRIRQEVHAIGPEGGMVSSSVVPQVQAVFPQGALTKKIKVGLQAQPIDPDLAAKLLGHGVAVSPVVTVEPRRRKFHKAITLSMPAPRAHSQGMINQYSGSAPTLRLLCSITGGTTRAQWEDVTGSTPLTFVNDCVSFTTTVSARFWLMDCRNIDDATKMATELYREAIHVPFMAKFVVFAKRIDQLEARLRVFCMTDDKEDKTLEHQEHFTEVAKSRDVEVLEGKPQYIEFAGNLVPITKSGEQLQFSFKAFRENRLPFSVRVKDQHADTVGRCLFMREPKVPKGEPPQQPICILNIVLPENIVVESYPVTEPEILKKYGFIKDGGVEMYSYHQRLSDMSNLLGEDWVPLASELGFTTSEINIIKSECPDSVPQQAQNMLRLWRAQSGNKAQGNTLELALRRIGREDIIPQCLNVDTLDQAVARVSQDQGGFESLKDELGPSRDASLRRNISLDNAYDEQDIMKDSESVESLIQVDKKDVDHRLKNISERDETKYIAEEKVVKDESDEEEMFKRSVAERREVIEKRLSSDREIPASLQKTEIVQEINEISLIKRQSLKDSTIDTPETTKVSPESKAIPEQKISPEIKTTETIEITKQPQQKTTTTVTKTEVITEKVPTTTQPDLTTTKKVVTETVEVTKTTTKKPQPEIDTKPSELEMKLAAQKQKIEERTEADSDERTVSETTTITTTTTTHKAQDSAEDKRRDSALFEGVSQGLEKLDIKRPVPDLIMNEDVKSPKVSKTPPPSPAEFNLIRDQVTSAQQEWTPSGKQLQPAAGGRPQIPTTGTIKEDVAQQESVISSDHHQQQQLTSAGTITESPSELTLPSTMPKPKPRVTKPTDSQIELTSPLEHVDIMDDSQISPVLDEKLDIEKVQVGVSPSESIIENYSDRKKFWENVSGTKDQLPADITGIVAKKRMSLYEDITPKEIREQHMQTKKRMSIHEMHVTPPIPKPRSATILTSGKKSEDEDVLQEEEIKDEKQEEVSKPMSEYMAAFQAPSQKPSQRPVTDDKIKEIKPVHKTDKLESEEVLEKHDDQKTFDKVEIISESQESDTFDTRDIGSRIPIFKKRQMSVSHPPVAAARKTIFERSVSLPTDDLQDVNESSVRARKRYFEQQMQQEMVTEQLMSQLDEESSPEHKSISVTSLDKMEIDTEKMVDRKIHSEIFSTEMDEYIDSLGQEEKDIIEKESVTSCVKHLAKEFEKSSKLPIKSKPTSVKSSPTTESQFSVTKVTPTTVKDLAKSLQTSIDVSMKKIEQLKKEDLTSSIEDFTKSVEAVSIKDEADEVQIVGVKDIKSIFESKSVKVSSFESQSSQELKEFDHKKHFDSISSETDSITSETSKLIEKSDLESEEESQKSTEKIVLKQAEDELIQKSTKIDLDTVTKRSSTGSEQSISSERSIELGSIEDVATQLADVMMYKSESISRPSDSLEVHVDKSEMEDSEKGADFDTDTTDVEIKSSEWDIRSEVSSAIVEESSIPEITYTLSGIQRRISDESEDDADAMKDPKHSDFKTDIIEEEAEIREFRAVSPINMPTESIPDTVWEVPVQSQPITSTEETTSDIPIENQIIIEKDEEFSESFPDKSYVQRDNAEQSEIGKMSLDLQTRLISEQEARNIASELIEDIEVQIQKRHVPVSDETDEEGPAPDPEIAQSQVSEYLRQLAEAKGLDEREVELVESVLARKQRELSKMIRADTQTSSMEITDEDLRCSGIELSPPLEKNEQDNILKPKPDLSAVEKTLAEVTESLHAAQEELIETGVHKKQSPSEFQFKILSQERRFEDKIDESNVEESSTSQDYEAYLDGKSLTYKSDIDKKTIQTIKGNIERTETEHRSFEDDKEIISKKTDEKQKIKTTKDTEIEQTDVATSDGVVSEKRLSAFMSDEEDKQVDSKELSTEIISDFSVAEESLKETIEKIDTKVGGILSEKYKTHEIVEGGFKDSVGFETKTAEATVLEETDKKIKKTDITSSEKDGAQIQSSETIEQTHVKRVTSSVTVDKKHEESKTVTSSSSEITEEELKKLLGDESKFGEADLLSEASDILPEDVEIKFKTKHEEIKRGSSEESSKEESIKSPIDEQQSSTSSSGRKGDSSDTTRIIEKHEVTFRKTKPFKDVDTSSSSSNLKADRRSGAEFETWSSSGESHYHSFEQDSAKSRPCSSDVEGMLVAGSSEYESALTSQETTSKSHLTSAEYHTAVSSLSSRESMKSLDSESSGHLASVEVSEASETLVPSAFELDGDILDDAVGQIMEDEVAEPYESSRILSPPEQVKLTDKKRGAHHQRSSSKDSIDISEDSEDSKDAMQIEKEQISKMKRSHEMTFQPEPKIIIPDSPQSETGIEIDEKYGSSVEEGSILSTSYSSTSSAIRTVVELSRADSEKLEGSMTISGMSLSLEEIDQLGGNGRHKSGSRESLGSHIIDGYSLPPLSMVESSTSTQPSSQHVSSATLTTSTIYGEEGVQSACTQVTSESSEQRDEFPQQNGPTQVEYIPEYDDVVEPKKRGHRRHESTSSFIPSMIPGLTSRPIELPTQVESDLTESDRVEELTPKEVSSSSDEKKDIDETEKDESYETEADQGFHRDLREGRFLDTDYEQETELDMTESRQDMDSSRPQSQVSKSDSESHRAMSVGFSDERPDSELAELLKQCSSEGVSDPIDRPVSPEPADVFEIKDDSPETHISGHESELDFSSSSYPKSPDYQTTHMTHEFSKNEIFTTEEKPDRVTHKEREHTKFVSGGTASEKSSFEEAEAEAAFHMVPHISPVHHVKSICTIVEDLDAEKNELEAKEQLKREQENRRAEMQRQRDLSPNFIPDITVTQHMAPLIDRDFHYPDLELEEKEASADILTTPQTPASMSSKSSEETDQGREYVLDEGIDYMAEEFESHLDDKAMTESKSEISVTVEEKTVIEGEGEKEPSSQTESPTSDSFEMLEKPDLTDDFVVIEEVAKEAAETDQEGKSVAIKQSKYIRKHDEEVEELLIKSAPAKLTNIKYYPDGSTSSGDELGPFDFEDSPPTAGDKKSTGVKTSGTGRDYVYEYDKELEASKKWIEMQFQGDQAAMIAAGYGYEMEFERAPLEDIKEEEINDFDPSSSRIGSLGSQKESGGSYSGGSVKDSFSSTPEYDVLAGRKFFTRSGEHDDVSMSSLQEFENLEQAISLENRKFHQGSQDSLSNGSFSRRYLASKSSQGDDVSLSSLKEFEGLESACIQAHKIEVKAKEEEALLAQIDEGHESTISESESYETVSGTDKKIIAESDEEDYEKRMFEIDEIIRQAQTNVERFIDMKENGEKTESMGRGDSLEEVAKVPDLDLDAPYSSKVSTVSHDDIMQTSTDSLDFKATSQSGFHASTDSLDMKTTGDIMTASTDSIEFQNQLKTQPKDIMTDSIEMQEPYDRSLVASDSLELGTGTTANIAALSDSIDEDGSRIGEATGHDQSSSSGREGDLSSSGREDSEHGIREQREQLMLGSTDSLEPSSSTATHATYQNETDSVISSSFTSGGSNTMVSSTDTIDPTGAAHGIEGVDLAAAIRQVWSDENSSDGRYETEFLDDNSKPYVTEVIEPCEDDPEFSHTIHRTVALPPEVRKVTFRGPDADLQLRQYVENFGEGEDVQETQEVDADGNVHIKRVVQRRIIVKEDASGGEKRLSGPELEAYFEQFAHKSSDEYDLRPAYISDEYDPEELGLNKQVYSDSQGQKIIYTKEFAQSDVSDSDYQHLLTSIAGDVATSGGQTELITHRTYVTRHVTPAQVETIVQGEVSQTAQSPSQQKDPPSSTTGETQEESEMMDQAGAVHSTPRRDQHELSDEMKELLAQMEEDSRK